jgi:hypothetical protein
MTEKAPLPRKRALPGARVISEEAIRLAVETGNDKYWEDTRKQHVAYERWRANDFKGECGQVMRGSLIVYIIEEVMKAIKADC